MIRAPPDLFALGRPQSGPALAMSVNHFGPDGIQATAQTDAIIWASRK